jgi:dephospho-CoA kinase
MPLLIALAGLSGAGKTTAADYYRDAGLAEKVYLGDVVLNEVRTRGLPVAPDTERVVRLELRAKHGAAILAIRLAPDIKAFLSRGLNVVIDAVFQNAEYECLQNCCSDNDSSILLAMEACFEIRSQRLLARAQRPCTPEELKRRDDLERQRLETDIAISRAQHRIVNEGSINAFHNELNTFWRNAVGPK